jgi:hypothetical protein
MKKDEKKEGSLLIATTMKNRFYPPFQTASIDIDYNKGINPVAGLLPLMLPDKANLLKKEGNSYLLVSTGEKFATYDSGVEKILRSDEGKTLLDKLNVWLKTTGYSTINENIKEAEELLNEVEEENVTTKTRKKIAKASARRR